ncbi:hybrid sensor histidine kinase/response regulator [Algibacter pacificus]|uniref:hybrid sensor histidine kinase/response regulator n=1 Tax=Algibacter pacificus TaxID=2599389 RepID=UPI0011C8258C|nr:ATP-binding protein [Algibacter pacificus]
MPKKAETRKLKDLMRNSFFMLGIGIYFFAITVNMYYVYISFYNGFMASGFVCLFSLLGFLVSVYLFLIKRSYIFGPYIVFTCLGSATVAMSYLEGLMSGYYWFQLGFLFSLPYVIRRETYFNKQTNILYFLIILFLLISFIISPMYSNYYEELNKEQVHYRFILNSSINFVLIMMFSLQALSHNKLVINKIYNDKEFAENEKERRTRVLSNLGHELRTQINSINGVTQLILGNDTAETPNKKYFQILEHCNNNMLLLVNDMLDIHKIESGRFELCNEPKVLYDFLVKITIPFISNAEEKNLELYSYVDPKLKGIVVNVDEKRLAQVIYNLLSNAIKFTEQGEITFSAKVINLSKGGVIVTITVNDTGIGIAPNNLNKVFESFRQIQSEHKPIYGGTGLGLAISKSIIEAMHSHIKVYSKLNEGTRFQFTLNLEQTVLAPKNTVKEDCNNTDFSLNSTVLIVEDNMVSMMYAKKLLVNHVYKIYEGANGIEAIDKIKQHNDIDLVLLDLEMPQMNGFKAIKHIKRLRPDVVVVAFTANMPSAEILKKLDDLGFDDILSKPFSKKELHTILKKNTKERVL